MADPKRVLQITPVSGIDPAISAAIWRMHDSRERTIEAIADVSPSELDWLATGLHNTLSSLLYHIGIVEMDWLYFEVLQTEPTDAYNHLFPHPMRDSAGRLWQVSQVTLEEHLQRLTDSRQLLLDVFQTMTGEDFRRLRILEDYDVSPEWVLHHLAQHEDEHRGEMTTIRTLYRTTQTSHTSP